MAKPKRLDLHSNYSDRAGVTIEYVKSSDTLYISGWYDGMVGIEGATLSRAEFERQLGIPATAPVVEGEQE